MPNELFYLDPLDWSMSSLRGTWLVLLLPDFKEIPVSNANSVSPIYGKQGVNELMGISMPRQADIRLVPVISNICQPYSLYNTVSKACFIMLIRQVLSVKQLIFTTADVSVV